MPPEIIELGLCIAFIALSVGTIGLVRRADIHTAQLAMLRASAEKLVKTNESLAYQTGQLRGELTATRDQVKFLQQQLTALTPGGIPAFGIQGTQGQGLRN